MVGSKDERAQLINFDSPQWTARRALGGLKSPPRALPLRLRLTCKASLALMHRSLDRAQNIGPEVCYRGRKRHQRAQASTSAKQLTADREKAGEHKLNPSNVHLTLW